MILEFPPKFEKFITQKARLKVCYGGRAKSASWSIARAFLLFSLRDKIRLLCTREYQNSIADSVHRVLSDQIYLNHWEDRFEITNNSIISNTGSNFIFKGLHSNANEIKSIEGIDLCWIAEAEKVSEESLDFLIPTVRKEGSEIWVDLNPYQESGATYQRFIKNPPPSSIVEYMTFEDNPWFPEVLRKEMEYCQETDIDKYNWIWLGKPLGISDALVFKGKFVLEDFETPENVDFYCGLDFGFANDPSAASRCFVKDQCLYIDRECGGIGVEIDETGKLLDIVIPKKDWPVVADSSRPETISFLNRQGYRIKGAKKGAGSVEDGISFLRSFRKIVIHPRCQETFKEFNLYSYKKDKLTENILPIPIDANNHYIDALRYATEDLQRPKVTFLF